jgi:4-azaleucine resistance transporter AzlC
MIDTKDKNSGTFAVFKAALQKTVPVMFGYVPLGIAFGFLLTQSGYFWLYAVLMSIIIYSGATQFIAIGLFMNHAPMIEIAVTTLLLNLRHSFFGLSLIRKFSDIPRVKPYLIFALTDETYALLTVTEAPRPQSRAQYYLFISLLNHLYWVVGTLAGALLGKVVKTDLKGMDFALTALFVVLAIEQCKQSRSLKPFLIGAVTGIICLAFVPSQYMLLVAILSGTVILLLLRNKR